MFDANLVLSQLTGVENGIGRLKCMIGAKDFVQDQETNMVRFKFMRGAKNKATNIKITLNSLDLYDIEFYSIYKFDVKDKGTFNNLYAEDLKRIFETETSLYLSL